MERRRLTLSSPSSEFKSLTLDRPKSISLSTKRRQQTHAPFLALYVHRLAACESVPRRSSAQPPRLAPGKSRGARA